MTTTRTLVWLIVHRSVSMNPRIARVVLIHDHSTWGNCVHQSLDRSISSSLLMNAIVRNVRVLRSLSHDHLFLAADSIISKEQSNPEFPLLEAYLCPVYSPLPSASMATWQYFSLQTHLRAQRTHSNFSFTTLSTPHWSSISRATAGTSI